MRISDWSSDVCSSDLEDQATLRGRCVACGTESDMYLTIEQGLTNQYGAELYAAYSQGGEMPTVRCPQCHHYTLVVDGGTCARSEERRVGEEGVRTCRSGWSPDH